jgi:hypothetical protein
MGRLRNYLEIDWDRNPPLHYDDQTLSEMAEFPVRVFLDASEMAKEGTDTPLFLFIDVDLGECVWFNPVKMLLRLPGRPW